jgi:hypothetical protein
MKTVGILLVVLMMQSCFYQPYYKDSEWWYFEEWDTNHDSLLDKDEFNAGVAKDKTFRKDKAKADSAVFVVVDGNKDNEVTAIEFYKWEVAL